MRSRALVSLLLAALIVATAACSGGDGGDADAGASTTGASTSGPIPGGTGPTSTSGPKASTTTRPASTTTTTFDPAAIAPLTGLPFTFGQNGSRPALAVKIDAVEAAKPQVGLDVADIVYEEWVEGATRYLAVFHQRDPGRVGPIRSVRPMDGFIVDPFDGLFAFSGGIQGFVRRAQAAAQTFELGSPGFSRDRDRRGPHNVFALTAEVWGAATGQGPPRPMFTYLAEGADFNGAATAGVDIDWGGSWHSAYYWVGADEHYVRYSNAKPHLVIGDVQITAANVIVQYVEQRATQSQGSTGGRVFESIVIGEGDALVFSNGEVLAARWSKADANAPTRYTNQFGVDIAIEPGTTWVHLVPKGRPVMALPTGTPPPAVASP